MSLITSCPACGTMFRVVADQLKISEGWVRCGHCSEVFDATANLAQEPPPEALAATPPPTAAPPRRPAAAPTPPAAGSPGMAEPPGVDEAIRAWEATAAAGLTGPEALASAPSPFAVDTGRGRRKPPIPDSQLPEATELDEPFVFRRSDLIGEDPVPSVLPPSAPPAGDSAFDEDEAAPPLDNVSFVRQARRKAFWRRPFVRVLLSLFALVLLALLALQVAYQEHDRLAQLQPQLRPVLEEMCARLQCAIAPPRQIDSVAIDSSGFNRLRNDTYKLSFALHNSARYAVAVPSLELTLTDAQDQPLLRRVLSPADLGTHNTTIAAGADLNGAVGIVVNTSGGARVAGYRLLAFYP